MGLLGTVDRDLRDGGHLSAERSAAMCTGNGVHYPGDCTRDKPRSTGSRKLPACPSEAENRQQPANKQVLADAVRHELVRNVPRSGG